MYNFILQCQLKKSRPYSEISLINNSAEADRTMMLLQQANHVRKEQPSEKSHLLSVSLKNRR